MAQNDLSIDVDPEEKRDELIAETEAAQERAERATNAVLESVKEGVEYSESETEWVALGECRFEVTTDIPSDVRHAMEHLDDPDPETRTRTSDVIAALPDAIHRVDDPEYGLIRDAEVIRDILYEFDREFPTQVFMEDIVGELLNPAIETMEGRVPDSFPDRRGGRNRNGPDRRSR